ncbi:MAG: phosphotransferase [Devosia sp.]
MKFDPPGDLIGTGKEAEIFAYGDDVLKLYRSNGKAQAFREAATLAALSGTGLRVPDIRAAGQCGDRWGLVMSRAAGSTFADAMLADLSQVPAYLAAMARLHLGIHAKRVPSLPDLKQRLAGRISAASVLDEARRQRLLASLAALPDGDRLCHGDFHPFNIVGPPDNAVIIDWLDAASGSPAADVCRSYLLLLLVQPPIASAYVDAYLTAGGISADAIFAWLPALAAARISEGVASEVPTLVELAQ